VVVDHLLDETLFVVTRREYVGDKRAVTLSDFGAKSCFVQGQNRVSLDSSGIRGCTGTKLNIGGRLDSLRAMIGATDANMGYTILPGSAARLVATFRSLTLVPLVPELMRPLAFCAPSWIIAVLQSIPFEMLLTIVHTLVRTQHGRSSIRQELRLRKSRTRLRNPEFSRARL